MKEINHFELHHIQHQYQNKITLHIDKLCIEKGTIMGLVGPNGSGKTTLMHIMSLILKPRRGEIWYQGTLIDWVESKMVPLRRTMTVVTQNPFMFNASVKSNIEYGLKIRGLKGPARNKISHTVMEQFGIAGFAKRNARKLSGGETQLVAMARGIAINPSILFLDEITANLDNNRVHQLEQIITNINRENKTTIVMTTHSLDQAYRLAHKVVSLFDGKLVSSGMFNLFKGECIKKGKNHYFNTGKIIIHIPQLDEGKHSNHIAINPDDIIITKNEISIGEGNIFSGKIIAIIERDGMIHIDVSALEKFSVQTTQSSFNTMNVTIGTTVSLLFKASVVQVL